MLLDGTRGCIFVTNRLPGPGQRVFLRYEFRHFDVTLAVMGTNSFDRYIVTVNVIVSNDRNKRKPSIICL
jgi:hypothetical protein